MNQDIMYLSEMALGLLMLDEFGMAQYRQNGFTENDVKNAIVETVLTIRQFVQTGEKITYFSETTEKLFDVGDDMSIQ